MPSPVHELPVSSRVPTTKKLYTNYLEIVVEDLTKTPHLGVAFADLARSLSSQDILARERYNSPSWQLGRSETEETNSNNAPVFDILRCNSKV